MDKKVGIYDVLESGSIVGNADEPIDFIIDKSVDFVLRLIFINDTSQTTHSRTASAFGKNGVQITFTNYNNELGTGNATPVLIGKYNGRELLFNFRIYHLVSAGKLVHYTWLLGKEVSNG